MAWDDGARKLAEVMQRSSQGAIGRGSAEHRPDDGAQMQVCDRERAGVTGDAYEYISNRRWWQPVWHRPGRFFQRTSGPQADDAPPNGHSIQA